MSIRIRTPDPDYFQNLTKDYIWQGYVCDKIFMKMRSFRYKPNRGKIPYLAMLKIPSKKFLDPDTEADDFQNLITSSFSTDTSVVKFL